MLSVKVKVGRLTKDTSICKHMHTHTHTHTHMPTRTHTHMPRRTHTQMYIVMYAYKSVRTYIDT